MLYYDAIYNTLIGDITIVISEKGLYKLFLRDQDWRVFKHKVNPIYAPEKCEEVHNQLKEYFNGERTFFELSMDLEGTLFQKSVWNALQTIEYGEVISYGDVAKRIGNPKAARAIGMANRANPIPIIIPCHRVIGKNGKLVGYMGKHIDIKEKLLELEQKGKDRKC